MSLSYRGHLLAVSLLTACGRQPVSSPVGGSHEAAASTGAISVVVIGSSTAAGFGLPDSSVSWPGRYGAYLSEQLPGSKLKNLAVSGYSTFHVLPSGTINPAGRPAVDEAHNVTAALAEHPDAIIVNLPSNDAAMGVPVDETVANLRTIAARAKEAGVSAWVSTSQPRALKPERIDLLVGLRDRTKQEFGDHALDFWTPLAAAEGTPLPAFNQGDGVHPNAEGHRLLFECVRAAKIPSSLAKK